MKNFLTIRQLANLAHLPEFALRRLVKEDRIPYVMVGNRAYLDPAAVFAALDELSYKH